jgi:hypothetical protein
VKAKKLTDFMPLYNTAKTGSIVIDEPPRDETPDTTTAELDKPAGDERPVESSVLPVLKSGDILVSRKGLQYRVHRVNKPKSGLYDEPRYRLERTVIGRQEWALDELNEQGMKLEE